MPVFCIETTTIELIKFLRVVGNLIHPWLEHILNRSGWDSNIPPFKPQWMGLEFTTL